MKRVLAGIALGAALILAATPALAAETFHWKGTGNGAHAGWSSIPWDADTVPAGTYFETYVFASTNVDIAADTMGNGLCVDYYTLTVPEDPEAPWDEQWIGTCDTASVLSLDPKLGAARLVGTLPVYDCTAWDDETGECAGDEILIGTFDVDVTLTGTGRIARSHGAGSSGTAGMYQSTWHGISKSRAAVVSGHVLLDGVSIIGGATASWAEMWTSRDGSVDVWHCGPKVDC